MLKLCASVADVLALPAPAVVAGGTLEPLSASIALVVVVPQPTTCGAVWPMLKIFRAQAVPAIILLLEILQRFVYVSFAQTCEADFARLVLRVELARTAREVFHAEVLLHKTARSDGDRTANRRRRGGRRERRGEKGNAGGNLHVQQAWR